MIYNIDYPWRLYFNRGSLAHRYIVYHPEKDYYAVARWVVDRYLDQYDRELEEGKDLVIDFDDFISIVDKFSILHRCMKSEKSYLAYDTIDGYIFKIILNKNRKCYSKYTDNMIGEFDDFSYFSRKNIFLDIPYPRNIQSIEEL